MRRRTKDLLKQIQGLSGLPSAVDKDPSLKFVRSIRSVLVYPYKKGLCRRCEQPLPKRKRSFCGPPCALDMMIRCNPSEAKKWVRLRDRGICAKCGVDTRKTGQSWEANHIVPVSMGGGHCSLDNYETLCTGCHRGHTNDLMNMIRARKRMKNVVHVVYSKKEKSWLVKLNGEVVESGFETQRAASASATSIAKANTAELFVHGKNGKIRVKNSFGDDPIKIKG